MRPAERHQQEDTRPAGRHETSRRIPDQREDTRPAGGYETMQQEDTRPAGGYKTSRRIQDQKEATRRRRLDQHKDHMNNKNGNFYINYSNDTKYTWLLLTTNTKTTNKII